MSNRFLGPFSTSDHGLYGSPFAHRATLKSRIEVLHLGFQLILLMFEGEEAKVINFIDLDSNTIEPSKSTQL